MHTHVLWSNYGNRILFFFQKCDIFNHNFNENFREKSLKFFRQIFEKIKIYFQILVKKRVYKTINVKKTDIEKKLRSEFLWKFSFLKIYVIGSTQVDLLDIVHVKVGFFAVLKMCIRARLGKFIWSTLFAQCDLFQ